jgi:hypothetical protein
MAETLGTDPGLGISGFGTTLSGSTAGPIGMITKLNIDGLEATDIDVSTMNAPGAVMLNIPGMLDPKTISIELLYERVNAAIVLALIGAANQSWTIKFPDGSTYVQTGHVKSSGIAIPMNDKISQSFVLKMSGVPVFHASSGA